MDYKVAKSSNLSETNGDGENKRGTGERMVSQKPGGKLQGEKT